VDKSLSSSLGLRWWVLAVLLPIVVFFTTAGVLSIPPNTQGVDIVEGRDLFRAHCGSCHFAKVGFPAHHGPNLHQIGRTGAARKPGMTAPQYILESILDPTAFVAPSSRPGMPRNVGAELPPDKLRNIVGFLASCGAYPDYSEIVRLEIPDRRTGADDSTIVRREEMELAEKILQDKGGCLNCHSRYHVPESQVFAPGIFNVGLSDRQQLHQSIVDPHREIKAGYHSVSVVLQNGKVVTGRLLARTDAELTICVVDQQNQPTLQRVAVADVEVEDGQPVIEESKISMMPSDFDKVLTEQELTALITLISQLN
jgi:putative heme-binding domain-containing protein